MSDANHKNKRKVTALPSEYPDSTGWKVWRNPKNGFTAIQIHYTADPEKRDPEWAREESKGIPKERWDVEMELSRSTFGGKPVYGKEFQEHHISEALEPIPGAPIYRGWDFGANQSCVMVQLIGSQLRILAEMPNGGENTRLFAPDVISFCHATFGHDFQYKDIIDPSGFHEGKTSTGKACADVMREFGLLPIPGPTQDPNVRIDSVLKFLVSSKNGQPCLKINRSCGMLIAGFKGSYQYPDKEYASRARKPLKNEFSHIHDALQYVVSFLSRGAFLQDISSFLGNIPVEEDEFAFF